MSDVQNKPLATRQNRQSVELFDQIMPWLLGGCSIVGGLLPTLALVTGSSGDQILRLLVLGLMTTMGVLIPYLLRLQSRIAGLEKQFAEKTNSN